MKKITSVCALLSLICSFNASAEWTGDYENIGYFSHEVISEFPCWPDRWGRLFLHKSG